ncbi:hypothetical protein VU01_10035 [Candidatus Electrothrix marina]|uniref:Uncharacterized protein n=2 Tax=Candidatus Electrothrix marina TaxID=1859130 RepID=A0A444JHG9_9BACT|nr:hypothetical protein VU01_10035 [Candidatus Electrothrix marina]
MPMISERRAVEILLSIIFFLLIYHLLISCLRTLDIVEHSSTEKTIIRINSLNVEYGTLVRDMTPLRIAASKVLNNNLTAQALKPDQARSVQIKMYGDRAFLNEKYLFASSEKVFLVMEFNQLAAGEHTIVVQWRSPEGQLINTSRHTISLAEQALKHRSYFSLKLMRNGLFTKVLTGNAYKGKIDGRWSAEIFFNNAELATQYFTIVN